MKMNFRFVKHAMLVLLCVLLGAQRVQAQVEADFSVLSPAGGTTTMGAGNQAIVVDWNLGEPITGAFGTNDHFDASKKRLTQGFEQGEGFIEDPFGEDTLDLGNANAMVLNGVRVYPNPVKDNLHVVLPDGQDPTYTLSLRDLRGTLLSSRRQAAAGSYSLNMSPYPMGVYLLEVENKAGRTAFKIVKVQ